MTTPRRRFGGWHGHPARAGSQHWRDASATLSAGPLSQAICKQQVASIAHRLLLWESPLTYTAVSGILP